MNKRIILTLIVVVLILTISIVVQNLIRQNRTENQNGDNVNVTDPGEPKSVVVEPVQTKPVQTAEDFVVSKLVASGWNRDSAESVYDLNSRYFSALYEQIGEDALDKELFRLKRLGKPEYQSGLKRYPEMATLLGSVLDVDPEGARNILKTLPENSDDLMTMETIYQNFGSDPDGASWIAKLFQKESRRTRIIKLVQHSFSNVEFLGYFSELVRLEQKSSEAAEVYEKWLFIELDKAFNVEVDSWERQQIVLELTILSGRISQMLLNDGSFRDDFLRCWTDFESILSGLDRHSFNSEEEYQQAIINYLQDSSALQLLHNYGEDGKQLYKLYGVAATSLFLDPSILNNCSQEARNRLVNLALNADERFRQTILRADILKTPAFIKMFERNLDRIYMEKMINEMALANAGGGSKSSASLVAYWNRLENKALIKELSDKEPGIVEFIPGYDVYQLCSKVIDGRDVNKSDIAFAALDAAFTAVDVVTLGAGMVVVKGTQEAGKTGAKVATKTAAKAGEKAILEHVGKEITKEAVAKSSYQTAVAIKNATEYFSKQFVHVAKQGLDITKFTRYVYQKSGLGSKSFKRVTQLDAHIFMRGDRRVVIAIEKIPGKGKVLLRNVMMDCAIGLGLATAITSDTGQALIKKSGEKISSAAQSAQKSAEEIERLWKENLSLWWIACQND
ncbi:MAG: hypothetical protein IJH67_09990 [Thermoguttaceae bacterium]|nr:hypothetical protein [Thermoguttaceae bacterium]